MRPEGSPDDALLWDMLDAARSILQFTEGLELADYSADLLVRRATERSLQILGEAARRISEGLKSANPEIPWRAIVGQRNVISLSFEPGAIVAARGREWVVLPESEEDFLRLDPVRLLIADDVGIGTSSWTEKHG